MGGSGSKPVPQAPVTAPDPRELAITQLAQAQSAFGNALQAISAPPKAPEPPPVIPSTPFWKKSWFWMFILFSSTILGFTLAIWALKKRETFVDDTLPRSYNAPTGLEFSYSWWMVVDDWTFNAGKRRPVFVKGDASKGEHCPAVYLAANENALEVVMDTYKSQDNTITVNNLPAKKWIHGVITVHDEDIVDVYINGQIKKSHKLGSVVKQNNSKVYITPDGGFQGFVNNLKYHTHRLTDEEIQAMAKEAPPSQVMEPANYAAPPY
jgi:hypothetical protein